MATAHVADAEQAALFRAELEAERRLLMANIGKRRALIERPGDAGGGQVSWTNAEVQLRQIVSLIAKIDRRFAPD